MLDDIGKACFHAVMKKDEAIAIFGSTRAMADALGVTRQAIYQWPDVLPQDQEDRVTGAAVRLGKLKANGSAQKPRAVAA